MRRFYLPVPYPCSCQTHGHRPPAPLPCPLPTRCPIQDTSVTLTQVLFISCTKEEYLARVASGKIDNGTGILGTQVRHIAVLAEMNLDGHELAIHINIPDAGCAHQGLEFLRKTVSELLGTEIGPENLALGH